MADKTEFSLSTLSLQDLCEKKSLGLISNSDFKATDFTTLDPRLQEMLFNRLRTENTRLLEIEEKWCRLLRRCPLLDIQIHTENYQRGECDNEEVQENGYKLQDQFREQWSYVDENSRYHLDPRERDSIRWHAMSIFSVSPNSDLGLCATHPTTAQCSCRWMLSGGPLPMFNERISSQLLLYRLTVVFGMPLPSETDGYKSCWVIYLKHRDCGSILSFEDYKGSATGRFDGSRNGSESALKLLNYLIGINCLHSYDGTLAGTQA